jgi:hypothetical protein
VALVAGLVSAVRLTQNDEQLVQDTASVIRSLIVQGGAVEPWLDPAVVRADMGALLVRADPVGGPAEAERLPALHWAADDEGPVAGHMLAARKALSAGDRDGFWSHFSRVLEGTNRNGLGSMTPGGDLDGRFPDRPDVPVARDAHRRPRPRPAAAGRRALRAAARQGRVRPALAAHDLRPGRLETYRMPGHRLATTVRLRQQVEPNLVYVYLPAPIRAERVIDSVGGKARLMPDGSLSAAIDPFIPAA